MCFSFAPHVELSCINYCFVFQQVWMNLTIQGIFPGSNILSVVVVDEMAKAAELKSDSDLMVKINNIVE